MLLFLMMMLTITVIVGRRRRRKSLLPSSMIPRTTIRIRMLMLMVLATLIDARGIPGSHRLVASGAPHMPLAVGPVILIDIHVTQLTPAAMTDADVARLRDAGFDDRAIHDATQVISYFNYINRIADGLGLPPEEWIDDLGYER